MRLFLHFLNREAYRAASVERSFIEIEQCVRVLAAATLYPLYTNFSNILEGQYLDAKDGIVSHLVTHGQLLIAGERPSVDEFIESRTSMYYFDSRRYPMYFQSAAPKFELQPIYIRQTSVTDFLNDRIEAAARHELGLRELGVGPYDLRVVGKILPRLAKAVGERGENAITRSLFETKLAGASELGASSRLISTLYIAKYLEDLNCMIPTGVPRLTAFDHLGTGGLRCHIPSLKAVLNWCGFSGPIRGYVQWDEALAVWRGQPGHLQFASDVEVILATHERCLPGQHASDLQASLIQRLTRVAAAPPRYSRASDLVANAPFTAALLLSRLRAADGAYAKAHADEMATRTSAPTILLVTATKVETEALVAELAAIRPVVQTWLRHANYVACDLGYLNGALLVQVQSEAGAIGAAGAQAVVTDAIKDFSPSAVIAGGIAFGMKPDKQELGDILISKFVVQYERAKLKGAETIPRGERIESSPKLLSMFRAAEAQRLAAVHAGILMSGEKLVDSREFVAHLAAMEPEAIGGEMEGSGVVSAAKRAQVDWIIVKAIVDWGYGKQKNNDETHQLRIARAAFKFIFATINKIGI